MYRINNLTKQIRPVIKNPKTNQKLLIQKSQESSCFSFSLERPFSDYSSQKIILNWLLNHQLSAQNNSKLRKYEGSSPAIPVDPFQLIEQFLKSNFFDQIYMPECKQAQVRRVLEKIVEKSCNGVVPHRCDSINDFVKKVWDLLQVEKAVYLVGGYRKDDERLGHGVTLSISEEDDINGEKSFRVHLYNTGAYWDNSVLHSCILSEEEVRSLLPKIYLADHGDEDLFEAWFDQILAKESIQGKKLQLECGRKEEIDRSHVQKIGNCGIQSQIALLTEELWFDLAKEGISSEQAGVFRSAFTLFWRSLLEDRCVQKINKWRNKHPEVMGEFNQIQRQYERDFKKKFCNQQDPEMREQCKALFKKQELHEDQILFVEEFPLLHSELSNWYLLSERKRLKMAKKVYEQLQREYHFSLKRAEKLIDSVTAPFREDSFTFASQKEKAKNELYLKKINTLLSFDTYDCFFKRHVEPFCHYNDGQNEKKCLEEAEEIFTFFQKADFTQEETERFISNHAKKPFTFAAQRGKVRDELYLKKIETLSLLEEMVKWLDRISGRPFDRYASLNEKQRLELARDFFEFAQQADFTQEDVERFISQNTKRPFTFASQREKVKMEAQERILKIKEQIIDTVQSRLAVDEHSEQKNWSLILRSLTRESMRIDSELFLIEHIVKLYGREEYNPFILIERLKNLKEVLNLPGRVEEKRLIIHEFAECYTFINNPEYVEGLNQIIFLLTNGEGGYDSLFG